MKMGVIWKLSVILYILAMLTLGFASCTGTTTATTSSPSSTPMVVTSATNSTVTANPTSVPADGATASTVTVILLAANSNRFVVGDKVSLAATNGSSTISAASGYSNIAGVVTFTVTDSTPETVTYTATDTTDNVVITATATITFTSPTNG